jgi:hypothetical protein
MKYTIQSQVLYTYEQVIEAESYEDALNLKDSYLDFNVEKEPWKIAFLKVSVEPLME